MLQVSKVAEDHVLEIRQTPQGPFRTLKSSLHYDRGERLGPFSAAQMAFLPDRYTLQIGIGRHAALDPVDLKFINHSCYPNVVFDLASGSLKALRAIEPGEELRCFYPATEWRMAEPFDCHCGERRCLGRISGAADLDPKILFNYALAAHVRELLLAAKPGLWY
jgi:hypothetical protein